MVNNNVVDVIMCESCQLGKGRRANFATENSLKASANFEHIVFDTKGKMDVPAIGGYYWAISFTCTFSEYNQWYLLKNKSDAKTVVMFRVVSPEDFRDDRPDPEFPDRSETPFGRFGANRTDPKKSSDRFG
eukprot:Pgem_evm1s8972